MDIVIQNKIRVKCPEKLRNFDCHLALDVAISLLFQKLINLQEQYALKVL